MKRLMLVLALVLGVSPASAATVHEWGKGSDGPSKIVLDTTREGNRIGRVFHKNAINWGTGTRFSATLNLEGYGDIQIDIDTTNNSGCNRGCPDTISIMSLPEGLQASTMSLSTDERKTGTIQLFMSPVPEPSPAAAPVPLPAPALLLGAGIGTLALFRRGKSKD